MAWLAAILIGLVAGSRAMMAPAVVAWAAYLGWLKLTGTPLGFLGNMWIAWGLTALAAGELVTDQLPTTPSRKVPVQFGARIISGAVTAAAIGLGTGIGWLPAAIAGIAGAAVGTFGGAAMRGRLATTFGSDRPAALIEDGLALAGGIAAIAFVATVRTL